MTPSRPPNSSRKGLLEHVLGEYMHCLDRGEAVDREQLLHRHPELADELRSYFAGSDEVERLRREAGGVPPTDFLSRDQSGPSTAEGGPPVVGKPRRVGDYEVLEQIGEGGMGIIYKARQLSLQRFVAL